MKALIIGGAGFVGKYLIDELQNFGYEVCATCLPNEKINAECDVFNLDIMEQKSISELLEKTSPDFVFHLAAQSSVAFSWKNPQLTVDVNIKGTVNLLEAFRFYERNSRLIVIGSGEEYGFIDKNSVPLKESEKLNPANVYAVTKACQEMLCGIYVRAYGKDIVMTRSFNHSGAGQSDTFVISDFCRQIAEIERGKRPPEMWVGNLSAMRDFTDVRDVARAYRLLAEKGTKGKVYNVGRGKAVTIQHILDTAISLSDVKIDVKQDPSKMRASDIPIIEPDVSEIYSDTGWSALVSLEQTVKDTLDYWRNYTDFERRS